MCVLLLLYSVAIWITIYTRRCIVMRQNWYWEPVKSIIKVNGEAIDQDTQSGNAFRPGDSVYVYLYMYMYVHRRNPKDIDESKTDSIISMMFYNMYTLFALN